MRFQIILNMPSHRGGASHSVTVDHDAKTIAELFAIAERDGYIVATELYRMDGGGLEEQHEIGISASVLGKIKRVS